MSPHKNLCASLVLTSAFLFFLPGCSADLVVRNADGSMLQGIKVYSVANYKVTKTITSASCPAQTVVNIQQLPVDPYYINVDPSWFAKSEFTVMLAENGTLKQVILNSTPQTAENLNAMASLVKAIGDAIPKPIGNFLATDCGAIMETIVLMDRLP